MEFFTAQQIRDNMKRVEGSAKLVRIHKYSYREMILVIELSYVRNILLIVGQTSHRNLA